MFKKIYYILKKSTFFWSTVLALITLFYLYQFSRPYVQTITFVWDGEVQEADLRYLLGFSTSVGLILGLLIALGGRCLAYLFSWSLARKVRYLIRLLDIFYQDNIPLFYKKMEKVRRWDSRFWGDFVTFLFAQARHESATESLLRLEKYTDLEATVLRARVEPLLLKENYCEAEEHLKTYIAKEPQNPWALTQLLRISVMKKDIERTRSLLRPLRKYHPSPLFLKKAEAQLLFLEAENLINDPLRKEFLLKEAFKGASDDYDIAWATIQILLDQGELEEAARLGGIFFALAPQVRFVKNFLVEANLESATTEVQVVQKMVGNWEHAPKEVSCLSALLLAHYAIKAHLWNVAQGAQHFLKDRKPQWAAFLKLQERLNQDESDRDRQAVYRLLAEGDAILAQLVSP